MTTYNVRDTFSCVYCIYMHVSCAFVVMLNCGVVNGFLLCAVFFSGPFAFSAVFLFSAIDVTWLIEQEQLQEPANGSFERQKSHK